MSDTKEDTDENERVLEALERLQVSLQELNDSNDSTLSWSHWRRLPESVQSAYEYISQGSELCKATSTKYTLVGKINPQEGAKLANELLRGCEYISTGALVLCSNESGCSHAARHYGKQACRAVITTVLALVKLFASHHEHSNETIAAQKTGAVWSTCDSLLKIPKGNANATKRQLFTFLQECNETMQEFQQVIDMGAAPTSSALNTIAEDSTGTTNNEQQEEDTTTWDDFLEGHDQQYSSSELPVATASLYLIKCSRGSINVTLKACESVGARVDAANDEQSDDTKDSNADSTRLLEWMKNLTNLAETVGNGMTDLGTCLYPPLNLSQSESETEEDNLLFHLLKQRDAIIALNDFILDAPMELPQEVMELSAKLKEAATARYEEAQDAIKSALGAA